MKFIFFFTLFLCTFSLHSSKALEIHVFKVKQCDSQLIVFPSGYSILIDLGDRNSEAKYTKHVATRIESILGKKKVDVFVLTHYHPDHTGTKGTNGVWYLLEKKGFSFGKFLKRDAGSYSGSKLSSCSKSKISWKHAGEMTSSMAKFVCYAVSSKDKTKLSKIAHTISRCSTSQITPPDSGAKVTVLMKDALGIKANGKSISGNTMSKSKPTSENDFSICMRIQYQKFVYSTCGDISGYTKPGDVMTFTDVESTVAPMMGEVDLLHVNHHGSDLGTNSKWCSTLKPTVSVISCGGGALPNKPPLQRLKDIGSKVYTTGKDCNQDAVNKFSNIVQMDDDVVITVPTGGKTFTVASPSGKHKKTFNIKQSKKAPSACRKL